MKEKFSSEAPLHAPQLPFIPHWPEIYQAFISRPITWKSYRVTFKLIVSPRGRMTLKLVVEDYLLGNHIEWENTRQLGYWL